MNWYLSQQKLFPRTRYIMIWGKSVEVGPTWMSCWRLCWWNSFGTLFFLFHFIHWSSFWMFVCNKIWCYDYYATSWSVSTSKNSIFNIPARIWLAQNSKGYSWGGGLMAFFIIAYLLPLQNVLTEPPEAILKSLVILSIDELEHLYSVRKRRILCTPGITNQAEKWQRSADFALILPEMNSSLNFA